MNQIVRMENVSWKRSGQHILSDINWEVNAGENWAVLGLNGSGKTSLLNIVSGYQFPTSGEVSVLGQVFGKTYLPDLRKEIGYVSSSLERFSDVLNYETVEEIVVSGKFASIGLYEQVESQDWERADEILHSFRIDYLKGKRYHILSQGEKRRVLIARALMGNPRMLIFDEPCSGLDILSREEVLEVVKTVSTKQCQTLYVTHHIEEIIEEITHALLIQKGRIIGAGPKQEVITDALLSETFQTNVSVRWEGGRPWLSVKK